MRLDRLLCELNLGSRKQVKELICGGQVLVDGRKETRSACQVDAQQAVISCKGREYQYQPYVYYMMNKPAGVITATRDGKQRTVLDVFAEQFAVAHNGELEGIPFREIAPVGRLDKDTVGLLLLTNDGALAHRLLSPGRHVPKQYLVDTDRELTESEAERIGEGVEIGAGERTRPARLEKTGEREYLLTITEGKFHQVKRMFGAVGIQVCHLKRLSMGSLVLDETLPEGGIRELTQEEVRNLC